MEPAKTFTFPAGGKKKTPARLQNNFPLWFCIQRNDTGSWLFLQTTDDWQTSEGVPYPLVSDQHLISIFLSHFVHINSKTLIQVQLLWPSQLSTPQRLSQENEFSMPQSYLIARHSDFVANLPSLFPDVMTCRQTFIILNSYRRLTEITIPLLWSSGNLLGDLCLTFTTTELVSTLDTLCQC